MSNEKTKRKRDILIRAFINKEELEIIEENIKRAGTKSKSDYIRQMCVYGKVICYDDLYFKKCFNELNKIGVNLNQIAKIANRTNSVYSEDIQLIQNDYSAVSDRLEEIYLNVEKLMDAVKNAEFLTLTEQINAAVEKLHKEDFL